jgi:hypothetical protein
MFYETREERDPTVCTSHAKVGRRDADLFLRIWRTLSEWPTIRQQSDRNRQKAEYGAFHLARWNRRERTASAWLR